MKTNTLILFGKLVLTVIGAQSVASFADPLSGTVALGQSGSVNTAGAKPFNYNLNGFDELVSFDNIENSDSLASSDNLNSPDSLNSNENANDSTFDEEDENEWLFDFQLITGIGYQSHLLIGDQTQEYAAGLGLAIDVEYGNFFIESGRSSRASAVLGQVYLGYHWWSDGNSAVDIVGGNYGVYISSDDRKGEPVPERANLKTRHIDTSLGVRYSYVNDTWFFSTDVVRDVLGDSHKGWIVDSYFGQLLAVGNWDIGYGISHTWYSSQTSNYYLGVEPEELAPGLTTYSTTPAHTVSFEFSTKYPISENWVFHSGLSYSRLSKNISDSPLVIKDYLSEAFVGFGYVF